MELAVLIYNDNTHLFLSWLFVAGCKRLPPIRFTNDKRTVMAPVTAQYHLLYLRLQTTAATDIVAISSEIRFNVLLSVISLAAYFECCGTTYFSPSLPMFAFVLDAGNVACLLLWVAGRGGRACVFVSVCALLAARVG